MRKLKKWIAPRLLGLGNSRLCALCGWTGIFFMPDGEADKKRFDARCPTCGAVERHRLAFHVLMNELDLKDPVTLHVAPEKAITPHLKKISKDYLSVDLYSAAMRKMDVTHLELDDNSFTFIWCSHVLEHVPDDAKAISELFRVCAPGGQVLLQVPIWRTATHEDWSITTPEGRVEHFYQTDHVRLYGHDFQDRLEHAGFSVKVYRAHDYGPKTVVHQGMQFLSTNEVFIATKP
ncbi:MAG: class I SAM-dependent methyltransferase [Planctomycetota bacterium]